MSSPLHTFFMPFSFPCYVLFFLSSFLILFHSFFFLLSPLYPPSSPLISLPLLCHSPLHLVSQGEALETVTTAAVCLFSTQTQLADQVPPLGHLPRILAALNHKNNAVPKSSIRLIHVLSENEVNIQTESNSVF